MTTITNVDGLTKMPWQLFKDDADKEAAVIAEATAAYAGRYGREPAELYRWETDGLNGKRQVWVGYHVPVIKR